MTLHTTIGTRMRTVTPWLVATYVAVSPLIAAASPAGGHAPAGEHGAAEAAHGAGHHGAQRGFGDIEWTSDLIMNPGNTGLLWVIINFAVLLFILEKLLFKSLRRKQADKHDAVKKELDKATRARTEAEGVIRDFRQRLEKLEDDAKELMADAKRRAEADRKSIIEAAQQEAERIKTSAAAAAERDAETRRRQIENEIVDQAVQRAEAVLRQKLGPADQTRMFDDYIGQIGSVDVGGGPR